MFLFFSNVSTIYILSFCDVYPSSVRLYGKISLRGPALKQNKNRQTWPVDLESKSLNSMFAVQLSPAFGQIQHMWPIFYYTSLKYKLHLHAINPLEL